jgi:hypothetical protein
VIFIFSVPKDVLAVWSKEIYRDEFSRQANSNGCFNITVVSGPIINGKNTEHFTCISGVTFKKSCFTIT